MDSRIEIEYHSLCGSDITFISRVPKSYSRTVAPAWKCKRRARSVPHEPSLCAGAGAERMRARSAPRAPGPSLARKPSIGGGRHPAVEVAVAAAGTPAPSHADERAGWEGSAAGPPPPSPSARSPAADQLPRWLAGGTAGEERIYCSAPCSASGHAAELSGFQVGPWDHRVREGRSS